MKSPISFLFIVLLVLGAMRSQAMAEDDDKRAQQVEAPSRVKDGVITIDEKTFVKADLAIMTITAKEGKTVIPASAIVWWDGKAWVYAQRDANTYARQSIDITATLPDGYEVAGLPDGPTIITRGAQLLLSEELGAGIKFMGDN